MTDEVYEHLLSIENEYKSVNNCPDIDPNYEPFMEEVPEDELAE